MISLTKFSSNTNPKSLVNDAFSNVSGVMWKAPHFSSSSHANCVLTCFVLVFLNLSLKHLSLRTNSSKPILKTKQWTGFLIYLQNNKKPTQRRMTFWRCTIFRLAKREYFFYKLWSLYNLESSKDSGLLVRECFFFYQKFGTRPRNCCLCLPL